MADHGSYYSVRTSNPLLRAGSKYYDHWGQYRGDRREEQRRGEERRERSCKARKMEMIGGVRMIVVAIGFCRFVGVACAQRRDGNEAFAGAPIPSPMFPIFRMDALVFVFLHTQCISIHLHISFFLTCTKTDAQMY